MDRELWDRLPTAAWMAVTDHLTYWEAIDAEELFPSLRGLMDSGWRKAMERERARLWIHRWRPCAASRVRDGTHTCFTGDHGQVSRVVDGVVHGTDEFALIDWVPVPGHPRELRMNAWLVERGSPTIFRSTDLELSLASKKHILAHCLHIISLFPDLIAHCKVSPRDVRLPCFPDTCIEWDSRV